MHSAHVDTARLDELKARVRSCPADLTWEALVRLLRALGYGEIKASGSRRKFRGEGLPAINLHAPHPRRIVKVYAVRQVVEVLVAEGLL